MPQPEKWGRIRECWYRIREGSIEIRLEDWACCCFLVFFGLAMMTTMWVDGEREEFNRYDRYLHFIQT